MSKLKFLGIENFRIFKKRTDFEFKDITILVGANSTGKSSLSKAIMLYKDSYGKNRLDFQKYENSFQTGGFENAVSKGNDNEFIGFYDRLEINNFPTLGETSNIYSKIEFGKYGVHAIKFYYNDQLLAQYKSSKKSEKAKFLFNSSLFFKSVYLPKGYEIREFEEPIQNGVRFPNFQGEGKYGIVDTKKPCKIIISTGPFVDSYHEYEFPFTPIYLSDNTNELEAILDLYRHNYQGDDLIEVDLTFETGGSDEYGNEWRDETFVSRPIIDVFRSIWPVPDIRKIPMTQTFSPPIPLKEDKEYLRAKFVDENIFADIFDTNLEKGQFANSWKKIGEDRFVQYYQSFTERIKMVYPFGDTSILASKIDGKAKQFIQKWCSEEGFNLSGILDINYDEESAFWYVKVGDSFLSREGQGIGQLVILLLNICSDTNKIIIIEEPENHLHPSYQSKLANMLIDVQKTFGHQFIIETHSEYLIRKLQYLIAKKEYKSEDAVIYNFRKATEDNEEVVKRIDIQDDGSLSKRFYPGFYDESDNLAIALFNLNNQKN